MDMAPSAPLRKLRASRARQSALSALCALACLSLTSCDWIRDLFPESFGTEYSDSTRNFIEAHALAQPPLASDQGTGVALGTPAKWDWAWRGKTGNSFQYMTLTDAGTVGYAVTSGGYDLAAETPAWRLELVNLAGDPYLESNSDPYSGGWAIYNNASNTTEPSVTSMTKTEVSHGKFLRLVSYYNEWAGFDPNHAGFIRDNPASAPSATYQLMIKANQAVDYLIMSQSEADSSGVKNAPIAYNRIAFDEFSVAIDTRFMTSPGSESKTQTLEIDDLRIVRTDIKNLSCLRVRLRPTDTSLTLVPGRYEFSLWVRRPPGTLAYDDDAGRRLVPEASFAAPRITIEMHQIGFMDARDTPLYFSETFEVGAEWKRLAVRMGSGNLIRFDEASAEPVFELSIYPFDLQDPEPGAVEIADPHLAFFLNGY